MPKNKMKLCATCLSFSKFEFPVSEDIKGMLRSLLYDFGFDEFFESIPPDKQLKLCNICNEAINNMIVFKERTQKSFNEFKKYWCANLSKQTTGNAVSVSSSSQTANTTPLHATHIEVPKEVKCEVPDPLEIDKTDTESVTNSNIYDSFIDVKEETNLDTIKSEPVVIKQEIIFDDKKQSIVNIDAAAANKNDTFNCIFVNNNVSTVINENFNNSIVPIVLSNATTTSSSLVNKATAMKVSANGTFNNHVNHNIAPINDMFDHYFSPVVNNILLSQNIEKNNHNFIDNHAAVRSSANLTKNFGNNNLDALNSYILKSNAVDPNDLEDKIQSNILLKCDNVLPINNIATPNNFNTNISTDNSNINNVAFITNTSTPNMRVHKNNDCIFKTVSMDSGQLILDGENNKLKTVKFYDRGNIEDTEESVMFKPPLLSKDGKLALQNLPPVITTSGSVTNSIPNLKASNLLDGSAITVSDLLSDSNRNITEEDKEKQGSAVNEQNSKERTADKGQTKWYVNLVSREDILKDMEEQRNHPDFLKAPYKCTSCVAVFPNDWVAETHKKTDHSEDHEFTCFACLSSFKDLNALNSHYYVHTIDKSLFHCITCEFKTRDIECIKYHICPNVGKKKSCHVRVGLAHEGFRRRSEPLPKDLNTMRISKTGRLYYCPKCKFIATRGPMLTIHYINKHTIKPKVQCGECNNFYKNLDTLNHHVALVHRGKKPPAEPGYCTHCDKWFVDKKNYNNHMKYIHMSGERKFECDECEKKFRSKKALETHKEFHAAVKAGVKNHKCNVCGKEYYTLKVLRRHIQEKHEKLPTRDYVCEFCGKAFFNRVMLRGHSAKHSDERPHKCSFCGDTFKYPAALYTHTKLKHKKKKNSVEVQIKEKSKENNGQEKKGKQRRKRSVKRKRVDISKTE